MTSLADLMVALEQAPISPPSSAAAGAPAGEVGVYSSAAAPLSPAEKGPVWDDGKTATGPAAVAALSSSRLRSIVTRARESHGPRRLRWSLRERLAWQELVVTRGEGA